MKPPEHDGSEESAVELVTLEEVVEDALCKLEAKFDGTNFVRVQQVMALAKEYLPTRRFEAYVQRYAKFMAKYRVSCGR